jgi:hypothetical protein
VSLCVFVPLHRPQSQRKVAKNPTLDSGLTDVFTSDVGGRACVLMVLSPGKLRTDGHVTPKDLANQDKRGEPKPLKERGQTKQGQEMVAAEWAESFTGASKLNLADALAWQRDAAKAGRPPF